MVPRNDGVGVFTKLTVVLLAVLFVIPLGALGTSDNGGPIPMGLSSRAGGNVTVNGTIYDGAKHPPASALVLALNATNMAYVNHSISLDGNYSIGLAKSNRYLLYMIPYSGQYVGGYGVHEFFPIARFIDVGTKKLFSNFTITPAYELILKGTDANNNIITNTTFTNTHWSTKLDNNSAFAVWADVDNGLGTKLPTVLIPIGEARDLWFQWPVPGYGYAVVRLDNNGTGYKGVTQGAQFIDVNGDLAFQQERRMNVVLSDYFQRGYLLSSETNGHSIAATASCENALGKTGVTRLDLLNTCSAEAIRAIDAAQLDRAQKDIEKNRKGTVNLTVKDKNGQPIEGAEVVYNETSHDFLFGVFDNQKEAGLNAFKQCHDIGVNYATVGFYWSMTEPTEGNIQYQMINDTWGIKVLTDMGYTVHAHALLYMNDLVVPSYMKAKGFAAYNQSVYQHVYALVNVYKDKVHIWNVVNEANSVYASGGFTRAQVTQLIKTGVKAIRDADPKGQIIVNNPFDWFGQSGSLGYLIDNYDNYTLSITDYLDLLKQQGVSFDIVGQQMYDGGYSSFFEKAGIGPGMPVPTFDLGFESQVFDSLAKYNKPIYMSEFSVSDMWNDSWKDAGYWHSKWNQSVQAEFLRQFYTIGFSKDKVHSLTWWDLDDNTSFLDGGALFDNKMRPKPVFFAMKDLIQGWTTNDNGTTDATGQLGFRGFAGNYNITVKWKNHTRDLKAHIDEQGSLKINVDFTEDTLKPDLAIHPEELMLRTEDFEKKGNVYISGILWNQGELDATNITVRLVNGNVTNGTVINDTVVPFLLKDNYVPLQYTWKATGNYGNQTLHLVADPFDNITETNESNNAVTILVPLPLPDWGDLKVSVVNDATGKPVIGASVGVRLLNGTGYALNVTGTDGNHTFSKVKIDCYRVVVQKDLYITANATTCVNRLQRADVRIRLKEITKGRITGMVFDNQTDQGMSGATVTLEGLNLTTSTNIGGGYSFMDLEKGSYNLSATLTNYVSERRSIIVKANDTVTLDFHLMKAVGILEGTVKDSLNGKPIDNATIMLGTISGQITGPDGFYVFINVLAGSYNIYVVADGYEGKSITLFVNALRTTWANVSLVLIPVPPDLNGTISGFVLDSKNSSAVQRALVTLNPLGRTVLTDSKGFYKFDKVPPGSYTISVVALGYKNMTKTAALAAKASITVNYNLVKAKTNGTNNANLYASLAVLVIFLIALFVVLFLLYSRIRKADKGKKGAGSEDDEEGPGAVGEEE
jgi:GH35 family endo-1,4-beta-xylanase